MNILVKTLTVILITCQISATASAARFNTSKDLLIAQFDSKPDVDDMMAQAALGSMLLHPDMDGVNYYVVAGAIGNQGGGFKDTTALMNMAFGAENTTWTSAAKNWNTSVNRVRDKVKAVLDAGGKVWVQEAGQSDFTRDWLVAVKNAGVSATKIKNNVTVVQHSKWNEDKTTAADLTYVKNKTTYQAIDDGNEDSGTGTNRGPNTPKYKERNTSYMNEATSSNNPNSAAEDLWDEAKRVIDNSGWTADWSDITHGGVDFSDCVENWWIFEIGNKADTVSKFWDRYVVNTPDSGLDLGATINAADFDAESHPNNNNKIRDNGNSIGYIVNGSWVRYNDFNFAGGCGKIEVLAATPNSGKIEVRYKSLTGPLLGTVNITSTGRWSYYKTFSKKLSSRGGTEDLYLVFKGGSGGLFNLKSLKVLSYADGRSTKKTENTSSSVVYSGTWKTQNSANDSGGSMKWSKTEGNRVKYTFTGDRAKVAVRKGPHGGKCRIFLDGNVVATSVNTYASSGVYKKVIHDTGVLKTYGKHTIEVVVLGGNKNIMFDFFSTNE